MKILVITPFHETEWKWFGYDFEAQSCSWQFINLALYGRKPWSWMFRALKAAKHANECDVVISHHPYMTFYLGIALKLRRLRKRHYAFSFNHGNGLFFRGPLKLLARWVFKDVLGFVVYSDYEKLIYGRYYHIPLEKFSFTHWAVQPPDVSGVLPDVIQRQKPYICCIGRNNRDFEIFLGAVKKLNLNAIVVCRTGQINGDLLPDNIKLLTDIPAKEAMQVLANAQFSVVPLKNASTGAGHMTIVSAMQLGIPQIITRLPTVGDYFIDNLHGIFVAPNCEQSLTEAIHNFWMDPVKLNNMSISARTFADHWLSEAASRAHLHECLLAIQSEIRLPIGPPGWPRATPEAT